MPGSGIVYTLTKRDAEQVAALADRARRRRRGLHRRDRDRAADRRRGPAAGQRPEVRRRDERAGDGLRQARPRLRRALPGARLGHRLLPAGRPRRPRDRARRGRPAARRRGPPHPGLLHRAGVSPPRARRPRARAPRRGRRRGRLDARADRDGQPRPRAASTRCSRCSTSRAPSRATAAAGCARPAATGPTTPSATSTSPRCAAASRRRWRASAPTGAASCARCRRSSTIPTRRTAGAARSAPRRATTARSIPRLVREAIDHLRSQPLTLETKKMAPDPEGRMRKIPAELVVEEGRALARLGDGGWAPVVRAGLREGRFADELLDAVDRARARVEPAGAVHHGRAVGRATRASSRTSRGAWRPRSASRSSRCWSAPASARRSARWPTPRCRPPTCAARFASSPTRRRSAGLLLDDTRLSGWTLAMTGGQLLAARRRRGLPARARDGVLTRRARRETAPRAARTSPPPAAPLPRCRPATARAGPAASLDGLRRRNMYVAAGRQAAVGAAAASVERGGERARRGAGARLDPRPTTSSSAASTTPPCVTKYVKSQGVGEARGRGRASSVACSAPVRPQKYVSSTSAGRRLAQRRSRRAPPSSERCSGR